MINLIYFLFALGIIVLVHELGHLIVAKRNGVYCHEFSIGMGPKIKQITKDKTGTTYNIRLIPLGGYVMMAGEENDNVNDQEIPKDQLLNNKKPWQKFKILIAGSAMNIILTLLLLIGISFFGGIASNSTDALVVEGSNLAQQISEPEIEIIAVNNTKVSSFTDITTAINNSDTNEVVLTTKDNGEVTVTKDQDNKIGIKQTTKKYHLLASIKAGFVNTWLLFLAMIQMIMTLFSPQYGVDDLAGPVGIYQASSQVLTHGVVAAVSWIAYLSINIGIMNLLPIPALDGGRIIFVVYEVITRKKVNKKVENYLILFSFLLLMGLFLYVTYNDIFRIFN